MAKRYSGAQEDHPARSNPIKLGVAAHSIKSRVHKSEKTVGFTECNKSVRLNQLDNQIRSMMEFSKNLVKDGPTMQRTRICKLCEKKVSIQILRTTSKQIT